MYVAVKGGERAIGNAHAWLAEERRGDPAIPELTVPQIREQMALAVNRVMAEGSLYDPDLAALAIKQARGDLIEAVFLIRAYRTTLPRLGSSAPLDTAAMACDRRISATFKDLPGGQVLGPTFDYTHRLLDFKLAAESAPEGTPDPAPEREATGEAVPHVTGFLNREGYSDTLIDDHILPMCAAIWSTTPQQMRDYPMRSFLRFFMSHGLLQVLNRPQWRTVAGGSRSYVRAMRADMGHGTEFRPGARRVTRQGGLSVVEDEAGDSAFYSDVVIASHADEALGLLGDASADERDVLGAFHYTPNVAVLHDDPALMPKRRSVWAAWNYIGDESADAEDRPTHREELEPDEAERDGEDQRQSQIDGQHAKDHARKGHHRADRRDAIAARSFHFDGRVGNDGRQGSVRRIFGAGRTGQGALPGRERHRPEVDIWPSRPQRSASNSEFVRRCE